MYTLEIESSLYDITLKNKRHKINKTHYTKLKFMWVGLGELKKDANMPINQSVYTSEN